SIRQPPRPALFAYTTLFRSEGGDAGADEVRAVPEGIAIDEAGVALGTDEGVSGADFVAVGFELAEGVIDPGALLGPTRDGGNIADRKSTRLNSSQVASRILS